MGEYAEYKIDTLNIYLRKNEASAWPFLMEVFAPYELRDIPENPNVDCGYYGYVTNVAAARERLDVLGYTLDRCFRELRAILSARLEEINNPPDDYDEDDIESLRCDLDGNAIDWESLYAVFSDKQSVAAAFRQVFWDTSVTNRVWTSLWKRDASPIEIKPVNELAARILSPEGSDLLSLIPTDPLPDPIYLLRIMLEYARQDAKVEYDCTLPVRLWDESIADQLEEYLNGSCFSPSSQIIILTEGSLDDKVIGDAFKLLRPNIAHLFRFFDHHLVTPERSSSALEKLSRAIISIGLKEKFIFLFDNDAVGRNSLDKLPRKLPPNMAAIHLPDLALAESYPTIGPDGPSLSNLNGRAVAIEFFLGRKALIHDDGEYKPVVWTGRDHGIYQGCFEDADKKSAQATYEAGVKEAFEIGIESSSYDWSGMNQLLDCIVDTAKDLSE